MKILSSQKRLYLVALVLLVVVNILVMAGVVLNRSGLPDATVELTERELSMPEHVSSQNSGLSLILNWRVFKGDDWLDEEKLSELGFDTDDYQNENGYRNELLSLEAFLVLENDGVAYQKSLKKAQNSYQQAKQDYSLSNNNQQLEDKLTRSERRLNLEKVYESRLFVIDAGLDPVELRNRYSDSSQYIITKGSIRLNYYDRGTVSADSSISGLSIESINLPLNQRQVMIKRLVKMDNDRYGDLAPPRYSVKVVYGSGYEPWIESIDFF